MKRIYKKNEKRQRVLILATGELGTVTDRVLMKRGCKPALYYQVKLDSQPGTDRWYWDNQLGGTREEAVATFRCGGQELKVEVTHDHEEDRLHFTLSGTPANLLEHRGLHVRLLADLVEKLTDGGRNVLDSSLDTAQ